jgi:hypothetical protein
MYYLNHFLLKLYNRTIVDFDKNADKLFDCLDFDINKPPFAFQGFHLLVSNTGDDFEEDIFITKEILTELGKPGNPSEVVNKTEIDIKEATDKYKGRWDSAKYAAVGIAGALALGTAAAYFAPAYFSASAIATGISTYAPSALTYGQNLYSGLQSYMPSISWSAKDGAYLVKGDEKGDKYDKTKEQEGLLIGKVVKRDGVVYQEGRLYVFIKLLDKFINDSFAELGPINFTNPQEVASGTTTDGRHHKIKEIKDGYKRSVKKMKNMKKNGEINEAQFNSAKAEAKLKAKSDLQKSRKNRK